MISNSYFFRIVERGFYCEKDASHVVRQILEALSVSNKLNTLQRFSNFRLKRGLNRVSNKSDGYVVDKMLIFRLREL